VVGSAAAAAAASSTAHQHGRGGFDDSERRRVRFRTWHLAVRRCGKASSALVRREGVIRFVRLCCDEKKSKE